MIKLVAAVRRKPGMTHTECLEYIEHTHGQIAREKRLGLVKYVQNHVFDAAFGDDSDIAYTQTFHRDSITELYFNDFSGVIQTFSDPYTQQKTGPDGKNFADLATQAAQLMSEDELPVVSPGSAAVKVMLFLKKNPTVELSEFFNAWKAAHEATEIECQEFASSIRRHVRAEYLPQGDQVTAYFGPNIQVYEGVSSMWFDSERELNSFRTYQRSLIKRLVLDGSVDPAGSFFVYAREVVIL